MWYTVQQPGYFNLLPTSGCQNPRGGEVNILREKMFLCAEHIFSYFTEFNEHMLLLKLYT
jgi:hypothetical protein